MVGTGSGRVFTRDVDGDGDQDIVVLSQYGDQPGDLAVLLNDGGSFRVPVHTSTGQGSFTMAAGDVDGDGLPDLALADSITGSVRLLLNVGGGPVRDREHVPRGGVSHPARRRRRRRRRPARHRDRQRRRPCRRRHQPRRHAQHGQHPAQLRERCVRRDGRISRRRRPGRRPRGPERRRHARHRRHRRQRRRRGRPLQQRRRNLRHRRPPRRRRNSPGGDHRRRESRWPRRSDRRKPGRRHRDRPQPRRAAVAVGTNYPTGAVDPADPTYTRPPAAIAIADLTGDGKPDVLVSPTLPGNVGMRLLPNLGAGCWARRPPSSPSRYQRPRRRSRSPTWTATANRTW